LLGRSIEKNVELARELGYLHFSQDMIVDVEDLKSLPPERSILITTGTQGEPMSALSLLSKEQYKWLKVSPTDSIIISASIIPGNERTVATIINNLLKSGAKVLYSEDIHVSGHGYQEELKIMLSLTKPKFFIPCHGEFRHMVYHASIAEQMGIPSQNIAVIKDGDVIELKPYAMEKINSLDLQSVYVDGKGVGDIGAQVLKDRRIMSEDGIVIILLIFDSTSGFLLTEPEIVSRGFIYLKESSEIIEQAREIVQKEVDALLFLHKSKIDYSSIKSQIKSSLRDFFYSKTERKPMLLIRIVEI